MATSRHYNRAADGSNTENTSTRVKDRIQIHQILSQVGLNPSDYIFSPLPQDNSSSEPISNRTSAFTSYPSHQNQDTNKFLKTQSQSIFTTGRPFSYVQQPPPAPPPPPANQPPSNNQQQNPPQSGSSFPAFLFGGSAPNTQNTTSQPPAAAAPPPPPPPPPPAQSGSSFPSFLFGRSAPDTQNTASQPLPSQSGPSNPLNQSAPDTQNTSSQSPSNMNQYNSSSRRSPPPPPSHFSSHPHDSSLSAEHYLREINSCDNPPVRVVKPSTQNVVYRKEIRIRYLQPPTPPPPAPIIIREKRIPPNPPQSPLLIRERKPEARTPPPLTIRERPPTPPAPLEPYVIEKNIPPPPPQPRQIIVERLPTPPPKPRTVIFEKWLPYKKVKRPVLLQKAPPREPIKPTRNVVIEYEPLKAFTVRRVIEEGVFRVDPHQYSSYNSPSHGCDGDVRIVERIEDLPPPSEQLMHVLNDYSRPVTSHSRNLNSYDCYPHGNLSEHVPSNIQHLLAGARPTSNIDQLTNVSRASSTAAHRQDRVLSTGYNSSAVSPTVVPIQRSHSKHSNNSFHHYTPNESPIRSHLNDIY